MELTTLPSTPPAPTPAPAPDLAKTEVGSYFVANYPPFSTWSAEHKRAIVDALDRPPAGTTATPLGL